MSNMFSVNVMSMELFYIF